jgi:LPXTG-site transpeptidase (sortase) family protein
MQWVIRAIVRLMTAEKDITEKKGIFLGVFCVVFVGSVSILARFDLLPEAPPPVVEPVKEKVVETPRAFIELPLKLEIPAINRVVSVANPTSTTITELDKELLHGAVRYPTSAKLGEEGNVVLFGHSSYLPVVGNEAYKTFNGIQKLVAGDEILVSSADRVYVYRVRIVEKKNAKDDGIPLAVSGKVLTLSTCNSFGEKSDRFVVTADFVESHAISS